MALVVHNTRTRRKEPFVPAHPKVVRPELFPELCTEYALPPASGEAAGRGGDAVIDKLLAMRAEARKAKDFAKADVIRKLLAEAGVEVEDTPAGPRWRA
jgi:cysteinyl-tRNA synthetase